MPLSHLNASPPPKGTVLVVDDSPATVEHVMGLLKAEGHEVLLAASGQAALDALQVARPDLILLDVMMPGMSGFEVCRAIRADPILDHLPVIMLTALDDRESRLTGFAAGANEFLSKPVDRGELAARVNTVMRLDWFRRFSAERAKVAQLVATAPDGVMVVNASGRVALINEAMRTLMGYPETASPVGEPLESVLGPEGTAVLAAVTQLLTTGDGPRWLQGSLPRPGADPVPVDIRLAPLQWEDQPGVQLLFTDIAERLALQAELQRSRRLESLGRLAGGIAHDFGNYLSAIRSSAELLEMELPEGSRARDDASALLRFTQDATGLVRNLMAFARRQSLQPEDVDVDEMLQRWRGMLRHLLAAEQTLTLVPATTPLVIRIDPTQLQQVLVNLVSNAKDALGPAGTVRIETAATHAPDGTPTAQVTVRDDGTGILEADLPHIFEPFYTTKASGTGLGLPTVHGIVTQSGGQVRVDSQSGRGTAFHLTFPLAVPAAATH